MADLLSYRPSAGRPAETSALAQAASQSPVEMADTSTSINRETSPPPAIAQVHRADSSTSTKVDRIQAPNAAVAPSRSGTLKKKQSFRRQDSLKRSSSRKSLRSSTRLPQDGQSDYNSVFHTPIPTSGNPTDILANRFQTWRKILKDLVNYFREIQSSYESRSKALIKIANVVNNTSPSSMLSSYGGLEDANRILRGFHKQALIEANKAKDIEDDVITQLNGLRSDLSQKIKEIKSLSGDFKNSVDKEKDATKRAVSSLQEAITMAESGPSNLSGKSDPFVVRLAVDRQVEKQIDEENYLHRAYLNLEGSGRELESIVVGEIQKAYNAYAGILKRDADQAHDAVESLRSGPIAMQKDHEWSTFVENDPQFVSPSVTPRRLQDIHYPGKFSPLASEIRAGMLERKSKYLKSYTAGWYILSPTHLHEFKSADHIHLQTPVMSLCLLDQKLGSRSAPNASSHKFSLKGKQSGSMHRGHSWVFRAESYDTMVAWYEDIRNLTETTSAEKNAFVRKHARSVSGGNNRPPSVSSDGMDEDEADTVPYSAGTSTAAVEPVPEPVKRPQPGGRFPSDLAINRSHAPLSPSSGSSDTDSDAIVMTRAIPPIAVPQTDATKPDLTESTAPAVAANATHANPTHEFDDPSLLESVASTPIQPTHTTSSFTETSPTQQNPIHQLDIRHAGQPEDDGPPIGEIAAGSSAAAGLAGIAGVAAHNSRKQDEELDPAVQSTEREASFAAETPEEEEEAEATKRSMEGGRTESSFEAATSSTAPTSVAQSQYEVTPSKAAADEETSYFKNSVISGEGDGQSQFSEQSDDTAQGQPVAVGPATFHRQATDISVSGLHVPGEYPPPTPAL